ncbi:hypothetical protein Fmac_008558 [Flemingia macrophylla]|uniref:Uncharacterized protein n=1 Tax=Flemingia macrophylla TaxID=520843 RepID=A0ABD1MXR9_9FABA
MHWDPPASTVESEVPPSDPILAEPISAASSTTMVAAEETPQYVTLDTFNRFKDELDAKLDATLDSKLEKFFTLFATISLSFDSNKYNAQGLNHSRLREFQPRKKNTLNHIFFNDVYFLVLEKIGVVGRLGYGIG